MVERPTQNRGYLDGLVLQQGKIAVDVGGGLCWLGNFLFWQFAHSPLKITEKYRHGYDVFPDVNRKRLSLVQERHVIHLYRFTCQKQHAIQLLIKFLAQ